MMTSKLTSVRPEYPLSDRQSSAHSLKAQKTLPRDSCNATTFRRQNTRRSTAIRLTKDCVSSKHCSRLMYLRPTVCVQARECLSYRLLKKLRKNYAKCWVVCSETHRQTLSSRNSLVALNALCSCLQTVGTTKSCRKQRTISVSASTTRGSTRAEWAA